MAKKESLRNKNASAPILDNSNNPIEESITNSKGEQQETATPEKPSTEKKETRGRKSKYGGKEKQIHIKVSEDLYEQMQVAAYRHKGKITDYLTALVEADLAANADLYNSLK